MSERAVREVDLHAYCKAVVRAPAVDTGDFWNSLAPAVPVVLLVGLLASAG